jgi:hypothetical protein
MLKRHTTILLFLTFLSVSNLFGQDKLIANIVNDSLIQKLKIKQVTENWFHDSLKTSPTNTTIERYNEFGQKTKRIHINYFYHKFIDDYEYNLKKNVVIKTQHYYDWNPYREKRKGDTIVKKTVSKYYIDTKMNIKYRPSIRSRVLQTVLTHDSLNRLIEEKIEKADSVKFGNSIIKYAYDNRNNIIERKHYITHYPNPPYLSLVDSLHCSFNGQLVKETHYYDIKMNEDKWEFDRIVVTTYIYNQHGLILEKTNVTKHQSLKNREFKPTVYRYEYDFFESQKAQIIIKLAASSIKTDRENLNYLFLA